MPDQPGQPADSEISAIPNPLGRYVYAIQAAGVGVWDWDIKSGEIWWSDNLPVIHGIDPLDFDGTFPGYLHLVHPDDRSGLQQAVENAHAVCEEFQHEYRVIDAAGTVRWINAKGRVFCGESGQPERMMGIGLDASFR